MTKTELEEILHREDFLTTVNDGELYDNGCSVEDAVTILKEY